jgi:hypothetical protein
VTCATGRLSSQTANFLAHSFGFFERQRGHMLHDDFCRPFYSLVELADILSFHFVHRITPLGRKSAHFFLAVKTCAAHDSPAMSWSERHTSS